MGRSIFLVLALCLLGIVLGVAFVYNFENDVLGTTTRKVPTEALAPQGIILPHHDFAREIIIDSYSRLSSYSYDLIVIIGPNHFFTEMSEVVTSEETVSAEIFTLSENIVSNNTLISNEHGIGVHLPYINKFFPGTPVLPVVLPSREDPHTFDLLVEYFSSTSSRVLFIASVDFAHDLEYIQSLENNAESIEAITSFDYEKINTFTNTHMDSPNSMNMFLQIMHNKKATNFELYHSTHGALLTDDPQLLGTSYVIGVFR